MLGGSPSAAQRHSTTAPHETADIPEADGGRVLHVRLDQIRPCTLQPRQEFSEESLKELADSIREQGILQPLIVRRRGDHFELIAGERRWRAAQQIQLEQVPIIVREADDQKVLELALIENLQRDNLNPMEEARGYSQLMDQFQLRQEDVATRVGKSRAAVANALRLLKLPETIQAFVRDRRLSVGHAKVILGLAGEDSQSLAAEKVLKGGLNVRQTEELVAHLAGEDASTTRGKPGSKGRGPAAAAAQASDLEGKLREHFGTKVHLQYQQGKGHVQVRFYSDEDLERILGLMGVDTE